MEKVEIGRATLYCGDCAEVLPTLGKVDAVVTSPPYNLGGFHQMHNRNSAKWGYNGYSDDMPETDYQQWQIKLCNTLYDISKGPLFYSHKNRIVEGRMISPVQWLIQTKWVLHQSVVVNKGSGANVDKRRFFPVHEHIYVCFKTPQCRLENKSCLTDVWFVGDEQTNRKDIGHPATMPLSVASKCLSATKAAVVLDPFMGAGTTGVACMDNDRSFIGIELDRRYFDIACERIHRAQQQLKLAL